MFTISNTKRFLTPKIIKNDLIRIWLIQCKLTTRNIVIFNKQNQEINV